MGCYGMEYLITSFRKNFASSRLVKTVLYGISNNTKIILDNFSDYNIVGLMDGYMKQGTMYDYPIVTERYLLETEWNTGV